MSEQIVTISSGKVRGYQRNGMVEYLGIPYAQPPVGELRFKRARPVQPWDGVFDAKEYGPEAVQFDEGQYKGAEDCLTINVQRPLEGENLPVFVYIHGGGYNTGGCNVPLYNGKTFVEEGIVYVAFQYRLNVLGFYDFTTYPGCEDFESNCGLSDQILAMQWIHENIAAFGGDPERVTICGESAGAASVVNMMACPAVKGTFQQAISQSALPNCVMTHEMARRNIDLFLEGMGWTEADLPRLRTDDPFTFLKGNDYVAENHQYRNPGMFLPGPIQDDLLPVRPIDAIRSGSAAGVKLIIGSNAHEGTTFVHPEKTGFPNSWSMIAQMFEKNGNIDHFFEFVRYYHPNADAWLKQFDGQDKFSAAAVTTAPGPVKVGLPFINFGTDYAFQVPAVKVAEGQRQYTPDVWMYRYDLVTKSGEASGLKASHAFDLPAMFGNRDFHFSRFIFDGEDDALVDSIISEMHGSWVRFIKAGAPGEEWPRYTGYNCKLRIFDRETRTEQVDRTELMDTWQDIRFYED
ncbi:MAG: carboxylesterase/lipase family protein [Clostridiales bacterium]|nr:carboxylesterase/lipase family protein [Clostridiales bacterium]